MKGFMSKLELENEPGGGNGPAEREAASPPAAASDPHDISTTTQSANESRTSRQRILNLMEDAMAAREQAERIAEALRESEADLRGYFDNVAVGAAQVDPEGHFIRVNDCFCRITGYDREELLGGMTPLDLDHSDDREMDRNALKRLYRGKGYEMEKRYLTKDGRVVWVHLTASAILDDRGRFRRSAAVIQDITERKRAEEELRLSEVKFARAFANNPAAIALTRLDNGLFLDVNDTWVTLTGFSRKETLGRSARQMGIWPDASSSARFVRELRNQGSIRSREQEFLKKSGETYIAELSAQVLTVGNAQLILSTLVDVTSRKRAQERILKLNRVHAILSGVNHAIAHISDRQKLLDKVCRVAVKDGGFKLAWIGMAGKDMKVRPVAKAGAVAYLENIRVVTRDMPEGRCPVGTAIRQDQPVIIRDVKSCVNRSPWLKRALKFGLRHIVAFPLRMGEEVIGAFQVYAPETGILEPDEVNLLAQISDDISFALKAIDDTGERRQVEARLRETKEQIQYFIDNTQDILFQIDLAGNYTFGNTAAERVTGYPLSQLLKMNLRQLVSPEYHELIHERLRRRIGGEVDEKSFEFEILRRGGRRIWLELTTSPVHGPAGRIVAIQGVAREITERKKSEALLRQTNRTLQTIRDCHEAILRAETESELLREICRIIAQTGREQMVWVGYAENDARKSVRPVAATGDENYLANAHISWADKLRGQGPVGTAIRTGKVCLCHDTQKDPGFAPWRRMAKRHGFGSVIALPLLRDGKCFGALSIYERKPKTFDVAERLLLTDLANDLAFGIHALRLRAERARLEDDILKSIEREQERIGCDLHDGLCQLLVGAKFRSGYLEKIARGRLPEAAREARVLETILNKAIDQSRSMARGLNPIKVEPKGLNLALKRLAEEVQEAGGPRCFFQSTRPVRIANHHTATHLYRIVQEAVQNAVKHADAKNIFITFYKQGCRIILAINDDGVGLPARIRKAGMGLNNMRMRASLIGAQLDIYRRNSGGTTVKCEIVSNSRNQNEST